MHAVPKVFLFSTRAAKQAPGSAVRSPFGGPTYLVRAFALPITLRGIRVSSHRRAGRMPAVRLRRADVVRVGAFRSYRLSLLCGHARSMYDPIGSHTIEKTKHLA